MKIALCLSGVVGSNQRWGKGYDLDYSIGYQHLKNAVIDNNVDVFIHSWSQEHEEGLCKLYNPVNSIFEKQVDFKFTNPKSFAIMSQGYTRKTAVRLALNHAIENDFEYDFIIVTRFDLAWFKQINFNELDTSKIYAAGPEASGKINDFFFIANSKNMEILTDSYDVLPELENLNKGETGGTIAPSYHRAVWEHLRRSNLLSVTKYIFHRPWGSPRWEGDIRLLRLSPEVKYLKNE